MSFRGEIVPAGIACDVCGKLCGRVFDLGDVDDRGLTEDAIRIPAPLADETGCAPNILCTKCWSAAMRTAESTITDQDSRLSIAIRVVDRARDVAASMVRLAKE